MSYVSVFSVATAYGCCNETLLRCFCVDTYVTVDVDGLLPRAYAGRSTGALIPAACHNGCSSKRHAKVRSNFGL
jgi:hypothetical protein